MYYSQFLWGVANTKEVYLVLLWQLEGWRNVLSWILFLVSLNLEGKECFVVREAGKQDEELRMKLIFMYS